MKEGNEELYDHLNDPEEHVNLANDPKMQEILAGMRKKFAHARTKARAKIETD